MLTVSLGLLCGCSNNPPSEIPDVTAATPEEKLELVMHRLDSAIGDAAAAQGSGVISQRKSSHRLIPPEEEGGQYRAEVMIETIVSLAKAPAASTLPKKADKKKPAIPDPVLEAAEVEAASGVHPIGVEQLDFSAAADDSEEVEGSDDENPDNGVTRRAIERSKEVRTDFYELVYEDDRWKLASEISKDDEVGQALFAYALRQ
jgi:hypothetical protein